MRLLVVVLAVASTFVTSATIAQGFSKPIHGAITRNALRPGQDLDGNALERIVQANMDTDNNQTASERHFDNAPVAGVICGHWRAGVNTWLDEVVANVEPSDAEKRTLKNRDLALDRFGMVLHATQDFYSHSNYVELGLPIPSGGFLLASCDASTLNAQLQTGYFSLTSVTPPNIGCPTFGDRPTPPAGYQYCHSQLHKDDPDRPNHGLAVAYATQATKNAWEEVRRRIIAKYESDKTIDAECLFTKLAWGKDRSCHRMWVLEGKLTITRPGPAPAFAGEVVLDGVKVHIEWTPARYLDPSQRVSTTVRAEFRFNGRMTATYTNPPGCRADEQRTVTQLIQGMLKVTPDPEPVEVPVLAVPVPYMIPLRCPDQRDNFVERALGLCISGDHPVSLVLKQDEDRPFQCEEGSNRPQRFTGKLKLDRPPGP
jgi:hypothetical protein